MLTLTAVLLRNPFLLQWALDVEIGALHSRKEVAYVVPRSWSVFSGKSRHIWAMILAQWACLFLSGVYCKWNIWFIAVVVYLVQGLSAAIGANEDTLLPWPGHYLILHCVSLVPAQFESCQTRMEFTFQKKESQLGVDFQKKFEFYAVWADAYILGL